MSYKIKKGCNMLAQEPFFILGCVRSGTTLLRDVFRLSENLDSPEETHFFRDAEPYGTPRYLHSYTVNQTLKLHRKIDNISDEEFQNLLNTSYSRKELTDNYIKLFMLKKKSTASRFYDKTPQNVYGIFLLEYFYPNSKFIHIYRDPRNVVSSLIEGKVMQKMSVHAGINYWNESMILIDRFKKLFPGKLIEVKYEDFVSDPISKLPKILNFIGEPEDSIDPGKVHTHPEKNKYLSILTDKEVELIEDSCSEFMTKYGYL